MKPFFKQNLPLGIILLDYFHIQIIKKKATAINKKILVVKQMDCFEVKWDGEK